MNRSDNAAVGTTIVVTAVVMLVISLSIFAPQGDGRARSAAGQRPLRVVTSTGIFADMAAHVGGDAVDVTALIPAGADPHAWDPSIREMRALAEADIFIYNGLGLEPWVERTLKAVAPQHLTTIVLSEGLPTLGEAQFAVADGDRDTRGGDPHMWLDIRNGIAYAQRMAKAFIDAAPDAEQSIRRQTKRYVAQLEALDEWFQQQVDGIPPERRVLVTDHDAYVYMAERYGLKRAGFVSANPDREPSPREMARLVDAIRSAGAPTLFAEPHVGTHFIDELARETGVRIGVLYTDSFYGDIRTYVEMMRANGIALRTLLGE